MPTIVTPDDGRHIVLLGSNGCGKSAFSMQLLQFKERYLAIDTQDGLDTGDTVLPGKPVKITTPKELKLYLRLFKRLRYVPKIDYMERNYWNYLIRAFFETSTKKKPVPRTLYIDEIFHMGYGHANFPNWLPKSMTSARQRKLSLYISTQRPRMIPGEVITEASKIYVFYLSKEEDIKYVSGFVRRDKKAFQDVLFNQTDDFSFIEIDVRKGSYQKFPPIKL
jgi:hypothetical protein